jgi:ABC-2 type transport system permease protein
VSTQAEPVTATPPRTVRRGGRRAAWGRAAWRQYRLERRMFWRNPSAAFFNFLLPLLFLAMFGAIFAGRQATLDVIVPGIAGMSVMATTFTAIATNLTFLREQGVLKRIRGTPMPSSAYLAGLAGNAFTNTALQVAIVVVAGRLFFGVGWPRDVLSLVVFVALGAACFTAIGVALSHAIPNFEAAPAYTNAVFLPMIMISGVFYDAENAPAFLRDIAQGLPLKHLIDGMSGAMVHGTGLAAHGVAVLVLVLWTAVAAVPAVRGFSWDQRRH